MSKKPKGKKRILTPAQKWIVTLCVKANGYLPLYTTVPAPLVRAIGPAEAVFAMHILSTWLARTNPKRKEHQYEDEPRGVPIGPKQVAIGCGLSPDIWDRLVKDFVAREILVVTLAKHEGNKRYYQLNEKKLRHYIKRRIAEISEKEIPRKYVPPWEIDEIVSGKKIEQTEV